MNWRASTGVQSISIVTFIVVPSLGVRTPVLVARVLGIDGVF
jgi:hypothetical protein